RRRGEGRRGGRDRRHRDHHRGRGLEVPVHRRLRGRARRGRRAHRGPPLGLRRPNSSTHRAGRMRSLDGMVVPAPRRTARVFPRNPVGSALFMILFTAGLYVVEAFDAVTGGALDQQYGIEPLEVDGLDGVLFAPLLHGSLAHLLGNTVPFLVFGFLAMAGGFRQFVVVTATIWILSGIGVWLTGDIGMPPGAESVHIGASGVIFGWLVFLLTRGFFARSALQILMAVGL